TQTSNRLDQLKFDDLPWIEVDALFESSGEALPAQGDDPAFFDNHFVDNTPAGKDGSANRSVFALWGTLGDKILAPLFGEYFGKAVSGWGAGVHGANLPTEGGRPRD